VPHPPYQALLFTTIYRYDNFLKTIIKYNRAEAQIIGQERNLYAFSKTKYVKLQKARGELRYALSRHY